MSSTDEQQKPETNTTNPVRMHRLEIDREDQISFLTYSISDQNQLTIWHTEVPEPLRGKGVGGELVKQAIALAKEQGLSLELICPFARDYVARNKG